MKDEKDKYEGQTGEPAKNPQARGRSDAVTAPSNGGDVSPHDESGKKPGE
jgi:hypothetical protein